MIQSYLGQVKSATSFLSTDELKQLLNDDEKLEIIINDVVSYKLSDSWKSTIYISTSIPSLRT